MSIIVMSNNNNNNGGAQTERIDGDTFAKTILDVILEETKKLAMAAQKSSDLIKLLNSVRRLINKNQIENDELCERLLELVNLAKSSEKKNLREATREFDRFISELNSQIEANYIPATSAVIMKRQNGSDDEDHFESRKRHRYFIDEDDDVEDEYDSVDLGDASDMDDDDDDAYDDEEEDD
jgi:hypothetical protein